MTSSERLLWSSLRRRQCLGCKFRRQVPVATYIVDFACLDPPLVIEVDGESHDLTAPYDARRAAVLRAHGFTVLRFANADIDRNLAGVLAVITARLGALLDSPPPSRRRHRQTPPS